MTWALLPVELSFSSMPFMRTCTTKSSPQASLTAWMTSVTKRARLSADSGPYWSVRWLLARENSLAPMLAPAALISSASKPCSCRNWAVLTMSLWMVWSSSVDMPLWSAPMR